jgi:stage V sporulation protein SpoVS
MEEVLNQEPVLLRPSKSTNSKSLASAISRELEKKDSVCAQAIGVQAVNQTVKAICIAGGFLGQKGKSINIRLGFVDVHVADRDDDITAILFRLTTV